MKLQDKEIKALNEYKDNLIRLPFDQVQRIVLFGSKARGGTSADSDLDTLIVVKKKNNKEWKEMVGLTADILLKYEDVLISPTIMDEKECKEWSPLMEHIKREGIELWNRKKKKNLLG